mgnify:CR=1 FL=1
MLELLIFTIVTLLYFIIKYQIEKNGGNKMSRNIKILVGMYVFIVLLSQFFVNVSHISNICVGQNNLGMALWTTLVPWLFIFGGIVTLLNMFPGWKQPFSNTFGYGVVKSLGINTTLQDMLGKYKMTSDIAKIYSNPALLINQFTPDSDLKKFTSVFSNKDESMPDEQADFNNLMSYIKIKDFVSEFIWYLLSGFLATTISYNTIATSSCSNSVGEMKKRHDAYEKDIKKKTTSKAAAPPPRTYYIRD